MTTELTLVLLSINLAALIALLLHLLGLRLTPDPLALIGGGTLHPQAHTAWRNKVNADQAWAYWSGVQRHG